MCDTGLGLNFLHPPDKGLGAAAELRGRVIVQCGQALASSHKGQCFFRSKDCQTLDYALLSTGHCPPYLK